MRRGGRGGAGEGGGGLKREEVVVRGHCLELELALDCIAVFIQEVFQGLGGGLLRGSALQGVGQAVGLKGD